MIGELRAFVGSVWRANTGLDRPWFLLRAFVWQVRKRLGMALTTHLRNGARIRVRPYSAFSGIFYGHWIEEKDTLFIRRHAWVADVLVDVGANVGLFSAQLFDRFSTFYLIEPAFPSYDALAETCSLNPQVDCRTLKLAVGDEPGEMRFLDEGPYSSVSRVVLDTSPEAERATCRVKVDTLNNILGDETRRLVVKVDVEGFEERVLRGAEPRFRNGQVRLVLFERLGRSDIDRILSFFAEVRYVVFFVNDDGTISRDDETLRRPLVNLFACPLSLFPAFAVYERPPAMAAERRFDDACVGRKYA